MPWEATVKFTNASSDERVIPALSLSVPPGGEFVLTADEAAGLLGQHSDESWFQPADDAAKAALAPKESAKKAAPRKATAPNKEK